MNKKLEQWKRSIARLNINKKITLAMVSLLAVISLFILIVFTAISQQVMREKAVALATQQIDRASYNTEATLRSISDISTEVVGNSWIQNFLRASRDNGDYTRLERSANEVLDNHRDSNNNLRFVALQKYSNDQLLYSGAVWTLPNFREKMMNLYEESVPTDIGNMSYTVQPDIFEPQNYSYYFFMPVRNLFSLDKEMGLLFICVPESEIRAVYGGTDEDTMSLYLTNSDGIIISSTDKEKMLQESVVSQIQPDKKGYMTRQGMQNMVLFQQMPGPGWYVVGEIPQGELLRDFKYLISAFIIIVLIGAFLGTALSYVVSRTIYRPIGTLIDTMGKVSDGDLQVQMNEEEEYGEDLDRLSTSFNTMVRQVDHLMAQVKEEQQQVDKVKFNMLQSQIQPHFLYNILDSIHWQAAYNKDTEVSEMISMLAGYYRLLLSQGNDIIPLKQELSMVENYLALQNMRYDNLVDFVVEIPDELLGLPVPKMTLQPLIENSIYHGFRTEYTQSGRIRLWGQTDGGDVVVFVEDNGSGMKEEKIQSMNNALREGGTAAGYGVQNVHKRFVIYFGEGYGLTLRSNSSGGVTVAIRIPSEQRQKDLMKKEEVEDV